MKAFITGVTGFAGSFLAEYLLDTKDSEIHGTYLTEKSLSNVAGFQDKLILHKLDLQKQPEVETLIASIKPDYIFHLAALTSPADSFKNPVETVTNNITIVLSLLEAIQKTKLTKTKILLVSSADVYGKINKEDLPIDEETRFTPTNPYAVSKITQDFLGLQYFISYNLPIIRVRPFNHVGPRQSPHFVVASFAQKITEIEKGKCEPVMKVGNLETQRDFTDVRDMVRAYLIAIDKGKPGDVYNLGSGKAYLIKTILQQMVALSTKKIIIESDSSLFRPSDTPIRICDYSKFKSLTGWEPKIPLEQSLKDTLEYWRKLV